MHRSVFLIAMFFIAMPLRGQVATSVRFSNPDRSLSVVNMESALTALCREFNSAFQEKRKLSLFQANGVARQRISALWASAPFRVAAVRLQGYLLKLPGGGYQFRNVPLVVRDESGQDQQEQGVVNFDAEGFVDDVFFGMEQHKYEELLGNGVSDIDSARRQQILRFLEDFRTAYNRKDIDLLEKTFSDNALVIMGRVIQSKPAGDGGDYLSALGRERVELIRMSKFEYLDQLRKSFARNQYIDVRFSEISIMRHPKYPVIYGVNLKQNWKSSTYGDVGYLFIMMDFEDEARPLIHVRAWQPEKFTRKEDVIQLGEFQIFKW